MFLVPKPWNEGVPGRFCLDHPLLSPDRLAQLPPPPRLPALPTSLPSLPSLPPPYLPSPPPPTPTRLPFDPSSKTLVLFWPAPPTLPFPESDHDSPAPRPGTFCLYPSVYFRLIPSTRQSRHGRFTYHLDNLHIAKRSSRNSAGRSPCQLVRPLP